MHISISKSGFRNSCYERLLLTFCFCCGLAAAAMLPTTRPGNGAMHSSTSTPDYFATYFRRLTRPGQMDFE